MKSFWTWYDKKHPIVIKDNGGLIDGTQIHVS
jgi:hypothetical protein